MVLHPRYFMSTDFVTDFNQMLVIILCLTMTNREPGALLKSNTVDNSPPDVERTMDYNSQSRRYPVRTRRPPLRNIEESS